MPVATNAGLVPQSGGGPFGTSPGGFTNAAPQTDANTNFYNAPQLPPKPPPPPSPTNNLAIPGAAENAQNNPAFTAPSLAHDNAVANLPGLQQPGVFENFWNGVQGRFNSDPNTTNRAEEAYQDYLKNRPNIAADPNLGAYYKDAEARAMDTLNQQAASRGAYGSSVALGEVGKAIGGLEADRAKNEAAYQLQKDAEQRQWQALGGTLGTGSDVSTQKNMDLVRQWLQTGGTLGGAAQDAALSRIMGGQQIATSGDTAQLQQAVAQVQASNLSEQAKNQRIQELYNLAMGPYAALSGMAGDVYGGMTSGDVPLFEGQIGAPVAAAGQAANAQSQQQAQDIALAKILANFLHPTPGGAGGSPAG